MGVLEGWILKLLDICLRAPAMEHSRIFVHTSWPNLTMPSWVSNKRWQLVCRNSSEVFWVLFHCVLGGGGGECDWLDKSCKEAWADTESELPSPRSRRKRKCGTPAWIPVTTPRIANPSLRSSVFKESFTAKEAGPRLRRGSEMMRGRKLLEKRPPRQTSGRQTAPFPSWDGFWTFHHVFLLGQVDWASRTPKSETQNAPKCKTWLEHWLDSTAGLVQSLRKHRSIKNYHVNLPSAMRTRYMRDWKELHV